MKAFLDGISLARWIIIVSLLASVGLGIYGWMLHKHRKELEVALAGEVPRIALDLQNFAKRHSVLSNQFQLEVLKGQADPASYMRGIAAGDDVRLGDTIVEAPQETLGPGGVLDTRYTIKPANRDRGFGRLNIANFLFKLESESRRMRVTRLRLEPEAKSVKPENFLDTDSWRWEAEVTSRTKSEAPPVR